MIKIYPNFTLTLQKSRIPQVQGIKAAAIVVYRKALITQEMRCHRLSLKVNNTAKKLLSLDIPPTVASYDGYSNQRKASV
jgi:hypothetical protein